MAVAADHADLEVRVDVGAELRRSLRFQGLVRYEPATGAAEYISYHPELPASLPEQSLTTLMLDRSGLLFCIARVLARHHINLQLAKIVTLGERVEDVFLIDGPTLAQNRAQIAIETELLDAISA